jgi:hypothetical protein
MAFFFANRWSFGALILFVPLIPLRWWSSTVTNAFATRREDLRAAQKRRAELGSSLPRPAAGGH